MPGHKGKLSLFGNDSLSKYDLTELLDTGDLLQNEGAITNSHAFAAEVYGSKLVQFSAGGATVLVKTMLHLGAGFGGRVLADRNCHKSVFYGLVLLRQSVTWLQPSFNADYNIPVPPTKKEIKIALENSNTLPDCVIITSPNYYGVLADVKGIAEICKEFGVLLLVDNAHGSHLKLLPKTLHPVDLGADLCVDSLHKTMPALTGSAVMHVCNDKFNREAILNSFSYFASTSPSFLVLASIDQCISYIYEKGENDFLKLLKQCEKTKSELRKIKGIRVLENLELDPVRICINIKNTGHNGFEIYKKLFEKNVCCEMTDGENIVLIPTPFNIVQDFKKLVKILSQLVSDKGCYSFLKFSYPIENSLIIQPFIAVGLPFEIIDVEQSIDRICADIYGLYPPGVPLVYPGERLSEACQKILTETLHLLKIKVLI